MRFQVECFENVEAFTLDAPTIWTDQHVDRFIKAPLRRVANLVIEADTSNDVLGTAWEIGNAPWNPTDADGVAWPHDKVRSMSSGDVVVVHTPDGTVAYGCLWFGWTPLPQLPLSVAAAMA